MPFYNQSVVQAVQETIDKSISAGTIGIMVLLAIGLIILGGGMLFILVKIVVPLLERMTTLTSEITIIVQKTSARLDHNDETERLMTEAINGNTGEMRQQTSEIRLLRRDFKDYQTVTADEIEQVTTGYENIRAEMVSFKSEIQASIDRMLAQIESTNQAVETTKEAVQQAVQEHRVILSKLDDIIKLLPPPPPNTTTINISPLGTPPETSQEQAVS